MCIRDRIRVDRNFVRDDLLDHLYQMPAGLYATFTHQGILPEQTLNVGLFDWLPGTDFILDESRPVLMKANRLHLNQFSEASQFRDVVKDQCILRDGLGMAVSDIENFLIDVSIPVETRERSAAFF